MARKTFSQCLELVKEEKRMTRALGAIVVSLLKDDQFLVICNHLSTSNSTELAPFQEEQDQSGMRQTSR